MSTLDTRQFDQMKEAHKSIYNAVGEIENMLDDIEGNAAQIAKGISRLAGILKIHLSNEDRYLYPTMLKNADATLHKKATEYKTEMGGLSQAFMTFKYRYNTQTRIIQNLNTAVKDIKQIFKKLNERMHKEDSDLYPLAEKAM